MGLISLNQRQVDEITQSTVDTARTTNEAFLSLAECVKASDLPEDMKANVVSLCKKGENAANQRTQALQVLTTEIPALHDMLNKIQSADFSAMINSDIDTTKITASVAHLI